MLKISIVMPVLNREDTIEKAIQSVLTQNYSNWELIIVDGGSTDKTLEIIKKYESHLAYWHSKKDGSAAVATNIGIEKASGDFIALLMADDWYEPETFSKIAEIFNANPEVDIITCGGRIVSCQNNSYITQKIFLSAKQLHLNLYSIFFGTSAICFRFIRKSLYNRIGLYIPFDANNRHILTNDKEFLMRAVLAGAKDVFVSHLGYTYLAHKESYSFGNQQTTFLRHCCEHMEIAKKYLLKSTLSRNQRWLLKYWYYNQATKLILFKLGNKEINIAYVMYKNEFKHSKLIWPLMFSITMLQVIVKRARLAFPRI